MLSLLIVFAFTFSILALAYLWAGASMLETAKRFALVGVACAGLCLITWY